MAAKPGVGFRIRPGALSHIEESGSKGDRRSIPFNLSADMFNVEGTRILEDKEARTQKLKRYMGGDERFLFYVPQGDYGERRYMAVDVLEGMYNAWKAGVDVNADGMGTYYFEGKPEDHTGMPNFREETDYSFAVTREQSERLWKMYSKFLPEGRRPDEMQTPGGATTKPKPVKQPPNTVPYVPPVTPPSPSITLPSNPAPPFVSPLIEPLLLRVDELTKEVSSLGTRIDSLASKIEAEARDNEPKFRTILRRTQELVNRR